MSEVHNVNVVSCSGGNDGRREGQQGKHQAKRDDRKGVKKRIYTLEMKREMLEMIKSGARTCEIMHGFNCPESTIRSLKNKEALTDSANAFSRFSRSLELQQIEAELSDSNQALPANQEEEEMVDDPTPSTSPPHNRAVLSVCKWGRADRGKRGEAVRGGNTNGHSGGSVVSPSTGFSDVQVEDLQEIVGQHQQQPTIEEMLEEHEEQQPTQEDDFKPGEPTTRQLTELLTTKARLSEQLEEHNTRPHPRHLMCSVLDKVMEEYKALYMSCVNARQQALITRYLHKAQSINVLANITLGDDDDTTDDDIEVLGDLLVEDLPQDFEGLDAEVRGGVEEAALPASAPTDSIMVSYSTV
ncbi:putative CENP-B N-terminal DNA-binding domain-containing protein 6 [Homarus americanus]|uniref:Putative CENP-B N-terminal DNA-binding domain-containing protein 6 n=1 Tax=Homarus americanus TaxID=6706 RepID=A0A8J5K5V2_HOMAM|nr:putative CENP-B N-terminal DNA-binding domain-containing protein 6 [Homarus americanus]